MPSEIWPAILMTRIVQWNSKGLRASHEEVRLLMNRRQPSCVCLQKLMLENNKYNLGREYQLHAAVPLGLRSKGGTAIAIRKDITHKQNLKTTLHVVALEVYLGEKNIVRYTFHQLTKSLKKN